MGQVERLAYFELLRQHRQIYDDSISSGNARPYVIPFQSLSLALLIGYLLISHRRHPTVRRLRGPIFASITAFEVHALRRCRSHNYVWGYGVGLLVFYSIVWSANLMLFSDPQRDFTRIERQILADQDQADHSTARPEANGNTRTSIASPGSKNGPNVQTSSASQSHVLYYQQRFPDTESLAVRMGWVADLICNFRGVGWNYQTQSLVPLPPASLELSLKDSSKPLPKTTTEASFETGHFGNRTYLSKKALLQRRILVLIVCHFYVDIFQLIAVRDPYFWGFADQDPPELVSRILLDSPPLIRLYRLALSLCLVYCALQIIFVQPALYLVGLLGTRILGVRAESWMYPDIFGSFVAILDKGLAGWWGGWWHQTFRFSIAAPSKVLVEHYRLNPKSTPAKLLQLSIAFFLTGCLHACASFTSTPSTNPIRGSFMFFMLQPAGIAAQLAICAILKRLGISSRSPRWLNRAANFVYVHWWFYYTGPFFVEDVYKAGIGIAELLPISPLKGLGFGVDDIGWWRWADTLPRWTQGKGWWDTGFAL